MEKRMVKIFFEKKKEDGKDEVFKEIPYHQINPCHQSTP